MLAMKGADEDPRELERRRDLWLTCHGQKLIMRMINDEYAQAAEASVPNSQAGYAVEGQAGEGPWRPNGRKTMTGEAVVDAATYSMTLANTCT